VGQRATLRDGTTPVTAAPPATSLVVCSLEEWGTVRRRIRILVDELVDMDPSVRVLYVAPPRDVPFALAHGRLQGLRAPSLEQVHPRVHVLRPRKWLPRVLGPAADRSLGRQVAAAVSTLGLVRPLVWVNDASYATYAVTTGWPTVYDITDDWLLAPGSSRQEARLRADDELLLRHSGAVVVCSPDLARTRGTRRSVDLIPNGVDLDLFRTPQDRPDDLPAAPVAVYVGTLHDERIDVGLLLALAAARPDLPVVLVGPDSLGHESSARLAAAPNIRLLGPRPYERVPAYLQHADVVLVPHLVNPFTESLDPIKAYECIAAGRPTVATPVAGFRDLGDPVVVAEAPAFVAAVTAALGRAAPGTPDDGPPAAPPDVATWHERATAMRAVMDRVRSARAA
jgi:teichuronic acid biosynthesis glycosyltransferase TuaH